MKKIAMLVLLVTAAFVVNAQSFIDLNNQFNELYKKGAYKEAVPIGIKALAQAKKEFGEQHINYAISSYNLAEAYYYLQEWNLALPLFHQAIKAYTIAEKTSEIADIAFCNNSVGSIYLTQKKYDSSALFFEKSFAYFLKYADEQYNNAITLMNNLGELYLPLQKYKEAKNVYVRILPVTEMKEGILSENYLTILSSYINTLNALEDYTAVEMSIKKILPTLNKGKEKFSEKYSHFVYILGYCLKQLNRYKEALTYLKEANKEFTFAAKTHQTADIAFCQNDIGLVYLSMKQYDSAASYFEKAFGYYLLHAEDSYQNLVVLANNLIITYTTNNKYKEQQIVCEKLLPAIEKQETMNSEAYCNILYHLCTALKQTHQYTAFVQQSEKLVMLRKKVNGTNSLAYAEALNILGISLTLLNNFTDAEKALLESVQIKKSLPVKDTASMVISYNALADLYSSKGEYDKAYKYYYQSIYLLEQAALTSTEDYMITLRSLGYTYIQGGRFAEAKKILNNVLDMQVKAENAFFSGNAEILVSLANSEYQLNELYAAQEHAEKAIAIAEKNFGAVNYVSSTAKELLGLVQHKLGNSNKAIALFEEALLINNKIFGEESTNTAATLSNFSIVYQELGRYADAEIILKRSLAIRKKVFGVDHPEYALSLLNLAMIYAAQAGYDNAISMLTDAMNIYIKRDLAGTNNFLKILNNLTYIVSNLGAYDEAKKLYLKTLDILDMRKDTSSIIRYFVFNNLAVTCVSMGNYAEAVQYALKAMDYVKQVQGVKSIEYIKSANNCLTAYKQLGDINKARKLSTEVIAICKEILGNDAELLGTLYFNTSILENSQNNMLLAAEYLNKSLDINLNRFRKNFYTLSEKEKLSWWQEQTYQFALSPSLLLQFPSYTPEMVNAITNQQLQLKGFVLNDASAALRKARASGNKALNKLIDEWQSSRTLLSKQLALPITERFYKTDSLEKIANNFEKNINQQASGIININQQNTITWQTVQSSLKEDEAAIEFIQFPFYRNSNYTDTIQYAAIIIRKNQTPQFVTLGTEKQISWCLTGAKENSKQTKINSLYRSTLKGANSNETFAGDSLYAIIWKPLMPYLQNITTVSYSPDGLLHKIAFHALPVAKDKLIIDIFRLQQYTSIRQITEKSSTTTKWNSVYLMGNADFNSLSNTTSTQGVNVTFNSNIVTDSWAPLPGTEKEINTLQSLFISKGIAITTTSGTKATEEKFKSLNNVSPSIIHLATHGFFLPDPAIKKTTNTVTNTENSYALSNEPLMRSGVIMAGANKAWSKQKIPAGVEDGIVTAYEIAQLNLSNTQLVVLSACETALGDLQGTEGVFGLQRAFKIAGVKNLIVSLWQVPDKETAELMSIFYNNMLTGISAREAFYKAQKEMRSKYAPFSWAAFVLIE